MLDTCTGCALQMPAHFTKRHLFFVGMGVFLALFNRLNPRLPESAEMLLYITMGQHSTFLQTVLYFSLRQWLQCIPSFCHRTIIHIALSFVLIHIVHFHSTPLLRLDCRLAEIFHYSQFWRLSLLL